MIRNAISAKPANIRLPRIHLNFPNLDSNVCNSIAGKEKIDVTRIANGTMADGIVHVSAQSRATFNKLKLKPKIKVEHNTKTSRSPSMMLILLRIVSNK